MHESKHDSILEPARGGFGPGPRSVISLFGRSRAVTGAVAAPTRTAPRLRWAATKGTTETTRSSSTEATAAPASAVAQPETLPEETTGAATHADASTDAPPVTAGAGGVVSGPFVATLQPDGAIHSPYA